MPSSLRARGRFLAGAGLLLLSPAVRAASPDGLFTVEVETRASRAPLPPEEVHDRAFPSFEDWRARAVKNNPGFAKGLAGARVAAITLRVRGRASAHRDVFLAAARRAAAGAGANLLCAPAGQGAEPSMTFQAYRVEHAGTPLPGNFIGYLAAASFQEQRYLENLMRDWTQKKAHASPALPDAPARAAHGGAPEAAEEAPVQETAPPARAAEKKSDKRAATPPSKSSATLDLSLLRTIDLDRLPPPGAGLKAASVPGDAASAPPTDAAAVAPSPDKTPAPSVVSAAPPARTDGDAPGPLLTVGKSDRPRILTRPGAVGAGALSLVVPGLGQWRAGDKRGAAGAFLRQAGLVAFSVGVKGKFTRDVERNLDDIYLYRAAKYGTGAAWLGQSVGTVMRHWPRPPAQRTADGAIARAIVFPGAGLWHSGRYELAVNVMAWEGFVLYWGTKTELRREDRISLIAFTHFAQIALTGFLAPPGRKDVAAVPSFDGDAARLTLSRRF